MYRYRGRDVTLWVALDIVDYNLGDIVVADTGEVIGNWEIPNDATPLCETTHRRLLSIIAEERQKHDLCKGCS